MSDGEPRGEGRLAPTRRGDRITGGITFLLAIACALEATTFRVRFLTDPVGPRALPWLAAALLGAGGLILLLRPAAARRGFDATTVRRPLRAFAAFVAYALLVEPLGFLLATTLLVAALALLFEGRLLPALFAGCALALLLWFTFVLGLGVPLPVGALFLRIV